MSGYGADEVAFCLDHPGWILVTGFEGIGYTAFRPRDDAEVSALTLDELDTLIGAQDES